MKKEESRDSLIDIPLEDERDESQLTGRKAAHCRGRGAAQPQGGQRAVEEPEHHIQLQGGSQRERPHGNSLLRQVRIVFKQRVPACYH